MKIVVGLRARNEERNIARFCGAYQWVDKILVADGDSQDDTVSIARGFSNVDVRVFSQKVRMKYSLRNPHGQHLNFIIDWAFQEENADWLILDDCDCFPNKTIKDEARKVMEITDRQFIYITRLYLWKNEGHFLKLSQPRGKRKGYIPSLWAVRKDSGFRFKEDPDQTKHQEFAFIPDDNKIARLMPPFALLHCPWQTEEMVLEKMRFYRQSGEVPHMSHPLEFAGEITPLPEWAVE